MLTPAMMIAYLLMVIGVVLLLDHYRSHRDDVNGKAQKESSAWVCYFQLSDISNHETWIVVCFTNAFSLLVIAPLFSYDLH
jgi:hypothetical protein